MARVAGWVGQGEGSTSGSLGGACCSKPGFTLGRSGRGRWSGRSGQVRVRVAVWAGQGEGSTSGTLGGSWCRSGFILLYHGNNMTINQSTD